MGEGEDLRSRAEATRRQDVAAARAAAQPSYQQPTVNASSSRGNDSHRTNEPVSAGMSAAAPSKNKASVARPPIPAVIKSPISCPQPSDSGYPVNGSIRTRTRPSREKGASHVLFTERPEML